MGSWTSRSDCNISILSSILHFSSLCSNALNSQGLDTAQPYFVTTSPDGMQERYVGTYEYSVGTQMLWKVGGEHNENSKQCFCKVILTQNDLCSLPTAPGAAAPA